MTQYDYDNQAWVVEGKYIACGHPKPCQFCFGTKHEGEQVRDRVSLH